MLKLRKVAPGEPLITTMTAVRAGDRLLIIGCSEPRLVAQLAVKPGLNGRACAVDESPERSARAAAAGEAEGALLEVTTAPPTNLPFDAEAFDVAVVSHLLPALPVERRVNVLLETARVLRAGGRCVVVQAGRRNGLAALFAGRHMGADEVEWALESAGFRAVRTIAEREGLVFVEGARR